MYLLLNKCDLLPKSTTTRVFVSEYKVFFELENKKSIKLSIRENIEIEIYKSTPIYISQKIFNITVIQFELYILI